MKLKRTSLIRVSYKRTDRPENTVSSFVLVLSGTESGYTVQKEGGFNLETQFSGFSATWWENIKASLFISSQY